MAEKKKVDAIYRLIEIFLEQKEISKNDEPILNEFGCSSKTLGRYLDEIEQSYEHIIKIKKAKENIYSLVKVSDIFQEFINNSHDISQLFLMARDFDPEIFKELENGTLLKIAKKDENTFIFKNSIMEDIKEQSQKYIFDDLKCAVEEHKYVDITYIYDTENRLQNIKCLKLIFMDNNWYLAALNKIKDEKSQKQKEIVQFIRLSFIKDVNYSKDKNSFQTTDVQKYLDFLKDVQNSLTLYGENKKIAKIKATGFISKYFDDGMKKFLSSQKFVKKEENGDVIFTLEYTQPLEILTLIQRWLPDLIILEPQELKDAYIEKLNKTLENHR
jgi:predicted DNA-binding transcriptional regulator YafY